MTSNADAGVVDTLLVTLSVVIIDNVVVCDSGKVCIDNGSATIRWQS